MIALTREGLRFALLLGIVAFAAYNTKNNLLYLMLSVGIAAVLVCVIAGHGSLRKLSVARFERPDAYAGIVFIERFELVSSGRWFGAFGVDVEGGADHASCILPGASHVCRVERLYPRRGRYAGEPIEVRTRFPFGLLRVTRKLVAERELIVYPRVRAVDTKALTPARNGLLSNVRHRRPGDEFYRLREYVPGDHIHHIHWRTSAKLDRMMVRELAEDEQERLAIGFVPLLADERDPGEFEVLVSAAASLVSQVSSSGSPFRFLSEAFEWPPADALEQARRVLAYLAEVEPGETLDPGFVPHVEAARASGEKVLLVAFEEHRETLPGLDLTGPDAIFSYERPTESDSRPVV